uniref:Ion transport domain-containing protein n=1 Tax=Anopheles funestus TaxID=62324 RepID=A0A182RA56_ANOFN
MEQAEKILQTDLVNHFESKNLGAFVHTLKTSRKDAACGNSYTKILQSVLGIILASANDESPLYSISCLTHGAKINKKTENGDYPIHCAVRSCKKENLETVLSFPEVQVDKKTHDGKTALDLLFDIINENNVVAVTTLTLMLLKKNATITKPSDNQSGTTSRNMEYNRETECIELRNRLLKKFKTKPNDENEWNLVQKLRNYKTPIQNESRGLYAITNMQTLLKMAIEAGNDKAAKRLINTLSQFYINQKTGPLSSILPENILESCCKNGNYTVMKYLIPQLKQNFQNLLGKTLLIWLINGIDENSANCRFFKCLKLCLNIRSFDIDEQDGNGQTALAFATKYKLKRTQKLLLEKGAYIGGKDIYGQFVINEIDPTVLKQHFDECIYTIGEGFEGNKCNQSHIFVMLQNFVPPKFKLNKAQHTSETKHEQMSVMPALMKFTDVSEISAAWPIHKEIRLELIEHPVIRTLLYIRDPPSIIKPIQLARLSVPLVVLFWFSPHNSLSMVFVMGILIALLFFKFILPLCVSHSFSNLWEYSQYKPIRSSFVCISDTIDYIEDTLKFIIKKFKCLIFSVLFYEMVLTVMMCCAYYAENDKLFLTCLTALVGLTMRSFLASYELSAEFINMLDIVAFKMFKYLLVYSWLFLTFALYLYHRGKTTESSTQSELKNGSINQTTNLTNFDDFTIQTIAWHAKFLQVLVWYTGEYGAENITFNLYSYFMFMLFIIIAITLSNLLAGLAVSDISEIIKESKRLKIAFTVRRLFWYNSIWSRFAQKPCHNVLNIQMNTKNNNEIWLYRSDTKNRDLLPWKTSPQFARTLIEASISK